MSSPKPVIGLLTAINLIVASMVGTGVFTSAGFQVASIQSKPAILIAWLVGGVLSLCGGLAYAELGAALPGNGGEYQLLARIYHPVVGFLAGVTSLLIGFSAPIAAYGIAFAKYLDPLLPGLPEKGVAVALVVLVSIVHSLRVETGSRWQDVLTYGKLLLIVLFAGAGLAAPVSYFGEVAPVSTTDAVFSAAFATGLIWISFSYSGWNAASYVAAEIIEPARNLPRAVILGTAVVTVLYLWLNFVFLSAAPAAQVANKVEVAQIAAEHLLGASAAKLVALVIALGLISTTGAMVMTGPRVLEAMGAHFPRLGVLSRRAEGRGPLLAMVVQGALAIALVLTTTFEELIDTVGIVLSTWCLLTVAGVIVLRLREPSLPRPYRTLGYPLTPLIFVLVSLWMIGHRVVAKPELLLYAAGVLALLVPAYLWARRPLGG